jgi:hypothetical protein
MAAHCRIVLPVVLIVFLGTFTTAFGQESAAFDGLVVATDDDDAGEAGPGLVSAEVREVAVHHVAGTAGQSSCGNPDCPVCGRDEAKKKAAAAKKKKAAADLKAAVAGAYAPVFYNNNFAYINNPAYDDWHVGEDLKQLKLGDCWTLDLGGQYRTRFHNEQNMRGLGLTGVDDTFLLHRTRLFANAKFGDSLRLYAEYIDAESNYEDFPPRAIEVDRSDMLNLFADARVFDGDSGDLWFRIGRQELLYGSERLISPLDWANTRRTFEGMKFLWQGTDWNVDFFATRPVIVDPHNFDSPAYNQEFYGAWGTYKAIPGETFDLFAVQYDNRSGANNFKFTTLGGRWLESQGEWLCELEGGVQFGENTDGSGHGAGFMTGGLGRKWADWEWAPALWCYYDWASGGKQLGAGEGFNHLFPLAHKYLGFMDLFGRSNIQSPNLQLVMQPHQQLKLMMWYYYLFLDRATDTPYNVNMTPFNPANAPASRDLGHELDFIATYSLNARMDLLLGYSHFFSGDYYKLTPGVPFRGDADFYYVQYHWNF